MTVTILAVVFLIIMLAVVAFGFKAVIRQGKAPQDINKERCSLCRQQFHTSTMIERQIGDHKLYYFCPACITALHNELISKN